MAQKEKQTHDDTAHHIKVIPKHKRNKYCANVNGSKRYTNDWLYSHITSLERNNLGQPINFMKTQVERDELKNMR